MTLSTYAARTWDEFQRWLDSIFRRPQQMASHPPAQPIGGCLQCDAPTPNPSRKAKGAGKSHTLKTDVLDQLQHYMKHIKGMKQADPEAYKMYTKLGAHLYTDFSLDDFHADQPLEPWFLQRLPSFGAIAVGMGSDKEKIEQEDKKIFPRLIYFLKMRGAIPGVQFVGNLPVYRCRAYWTFPKQTGPGYSNAAWEWYVTVRDGAVLPLLHLVNETQRISHRDGRTSQIAHQRWGIPDDMESWATQNDIAPKDFMARVFILSANIWQQRAMQMVRVAATKGAHTAVFSVDPTATAGFFDDRESVVSPSGRRSPIFHIVRTHRRGNKYIKTHFSGLRDFSWNGYKIKITVPGRDHIDTSDFNLDAFDESELSVGTEIGDFAEMLADHIKGESSSRLLERIGESDAA